MSSYSPSEPSFQPGPTFSAYPDPPSSTSPRAPVAQVVPHGYGYPSNQDPSLQQTPPQQDAVSKPNGQQHSRSANRLRKACDNCSIRKVKCDEGGSPCKACQSLDIPCTFDRPTKRRGPPNKLAEHIKRQKTGEHENTMQFSGPSDAVAAQSLAALRQSHDLPGPQSHGLPAPQPPGLIGPQHQTLSVESIIQQPVLGQLIDDYFTFIHPVIPMPHQPSFADAFKSHYTKTGQGVDDSPFVSLVASMISVLTSSFPRRARERLKTAGLATVFTSSMSLIERCQQMIDRTHVATYYREYTVDDAIISYLQGVLNISMNYEKAAIRHYKDCLANLVSMGLQKAIPPAKNTNGQPDLSLNSGPPPVASRGPMYDTIQYEMARRVFWNCFASVKSREQLGTMPSELCIPPPTKAEQWPSKPSQVDDDQILEDEIKEQPPAILSELVGFDINIRIFDAYPKVSCRELLHGVDVLVDWHSQKREIIDSLNHVKKLVDRLPAPFRLSPKGQASSAQHPPQLYPDLEAGRFPAKQVSLEAKDAEDRRNIMINIQKANIHATQLGTRSYLVEKFFTLSELNDARRNKSSPPAFSSTDEDDQLHSNMKKEWNEIIHLLLHMISTIDPLYMEPNGASLISKIRAIAMTLYEIPPARQDVLPGDDVNNYLRRFADTLGELEKTVIASYDNLNSDDEDAMLRVWAGLRHQQHVFLEREDKTRDTESRKT